MDEGGDFGVVGGLLCGVEIILLALEVAIKAGTFGGVPENAFTGNVFIMPGFIEKIEMNELGVAGEIFGRFHVPDGVEVKDLAL